MGYSERERADIYWNRAMISAVVCNANAGALNPFMKKYPCINRFSSHQKQNLYS